MPRGGKKPGAGRPLKEPLVILPDDYGRRWHTRFYLREMKKHRASDLAIQVMRNELDRQTEHIAAAKARQAKGRK